MSLSARLQLDTMHTMIDCSTNLKKTVKQFSTTEAGQTHCILDNSTSHDEPQCRHVIAAILARRNATAEFHNVARARKQAWPAYMPISFDNEISHVATLTIWRISWPSCGKKIKIYGETC